MNTRVVISIMMVYFLGFAGVVYVVQQVNAPVIREIRDQQLVILDKLAQLEQPMNGAGDEAGGAAGPASLDRRLAGLERKVDTVLDIFRNVEKQAQAQRPPTEDFDKVYDIPIDGSPVLGRPDAPVTIVEFMDFQCPYCARFHPTILEVVKAYPNQVKVVMKNFPLSFHARALPAAMAAMAAGEQGKYWDMADTLFKNFQNLSDENIESYAKSIGLDMNRFKKDYEGRQEEWKAIVAKDLKLGGDVDVRGTPTFYINGRKAQGRSLADYKKAIDEIVAGE